MLEFKTLVKHAFASSQVVFICNATFIVGEVKDTYSRIDKPLYVLENETLWEQFQFKDLKRKNELAEINGNKILWNSDHTKSFLDRRGDFGNVSLIGMLLARQDSNESTRN